MTYQDSNLSRIGLARIGSWAPLVLSLAVAGCSDKAASSTESESAAPGMRVPENVSAEQERDLLAESFPLYGAVTGTHLRVVAKPQADATVVGWLRVGTTIRLGKDVKKSAACQAGYQEIYPTGWVCPSDGIEVRAEAIVLEVPSDEGWKFGQVEEAAKRGGLVLPPVATEEPLPYDYYLVKEPAVSEYHRLPSRDEQRTAVAKAEHFLQLLQTDEKRARAYLDGKGPGPVGTAVTHRYLDRGFFVASNGSEVRAQRRFVRTTQGRYIKGARLERYRGSEFHGVELGDKAQLPIAISVRTARPLIRVDREDGTVGWQEDEAVEPIERQTVLQAWKGRENIGGTVVHILEGERYLKSWFAAVAEKIARPEGVAPKEAWVHVDISEQTIVLYKGDEPVYASLVSSGVEGHDTPKGLFEIRRKLITDTMANLGPDAGDDRYRIEDVPWTQYFEGSIALHAAFWHTKYGIPRSHGCVNLSPRDARRVFEHTSPKVPEGWHGLSTDGTQFHGSHVYVTD